MDFGDSGEYLHNVARIRTIALAALALVVCLPAPASAKITFAVYEGPNAERVGQGGTKMTEKGIDWWTAGQPPRRFKILGILSDSRTNKPFRGEAIGSKAIAKKVIELGGSAVLIWNQSEAAVGSVIVGSGNQYGGSASAKTITRRATTLIVIRYLD